MSPLGHHGPHHAGWMSNYEATLPLAEGVQMLSDVLSALLASGQVEIDGILVRPPTEPYFTLRYEQMPRGELKLKLEIEWTPDGQAGTNRGARPQIV